MIGVNKERLSQVVIFPNSCKELFLFVLFLIRHVNNPLHRLDAFCCKGAYISDGKGQRRGQVKEKPRAQDK